MRILAILSFLSLVPGVRAFADDNWPRFRGAEGRGVSDTAVPVKIGPESLAWSAELPGPGSSSWGTK